MWKIALEEQYLSDLVSMAKPEVLGPYTRKDNRKIVIIKNKGSYRTMSYPKYLLMEHLGIPLTSKLGDDFTVDHIDRDKENNDINNLRVVPRAQHSKDDTRRVKLIKMKCHMCGKKFERSPRLLRDKAKKGNASGFCSRRCSGLYSRMRQLNKIKKLPKQRYVPSKYYRNKKSLYNVAEFLIQKYGFIL